MKKASRKHESEGGPVRMTDDQRPDDDRTTETCAEPDQIAVFSKVAAPKIRSGLITGQLPAHTVAVETTAWNPARTLSTTPPENEGGRVACMCQQGSPGAHVSLQGQLNAHTNASAVDVSSFQRLKQNPRRGSVYLCTGQYRSLRQFCRIPNASPIPAGLSSRPSLHPRVLGGAKTVLHDPKLQAWQGPEMMRSHTNLDCRRAARGLALLSRCWTEQAVGKKFEPSSLHHGVVCAAVQNLSLRPGSPRDPYRESRMASPRAVWRALFRFTTWKRRTSQHHHHVPSRRLASPER